MRPTCRQSLGHGMSLAENYQAVVLISADEMWEKYNKNPEAKGIPEFYCIMRGGSIQLYPMIDPASCHLMAAQGVI